MAGARQHVGALLDINPATPRNWLTRTEQADTGPAPATAAESDEIKALRRESSNYAAPRRYRGQPARFRSDGGRPPTAVIVGYADEYADRSGAS
ncbi:hypothetical protein ACWEPH_21760 [Nocardia beijingensis]